jgi:long-chain acyl-CoA synthetase
LQLAFDTQTTHGLQRFGHVSTAYVAGERSGPVPEGELSDAWGFSSAYEHSKYQAECLVRQASASVPVSIFRPGIITGDSRTGAIRSFNTLYYPLRLYMTGLLKIAPTGPEMRVDMTPVDYVASAIQKLMLDERAAGLTFHLTQPFAHAPTLREITDETRRWARQNMGLELAAPLYLPVPWLHHFGRHRWMAGLVERIVGKDLAAMVKLLPYFHKQPEFLRNNTDRLLGPYPHRWQDLMPALLDFAVRHSFWHPTQRTVHEQILHRLGSKRKPLVYHDLSISKDADSIQQVTKPAVEMRAELLAAVTALRSLGLQTGDRVAILGPNSSRHFIAVVAAGLAGGVSVPLYHTLPVNEIDRLLQDCQARLFFAGSADVLASLDSMTFDGRVIAMNRSNSPTNSRQMYSWQEFLAFGKDQHAPLEPVDMDAPAALFYTSGTTGQPKAVIYRHAQLKWLAETLASMYPWHERNRRGSYLSYLPMSHVVEGILASYSPYYVPAALNIYFLEEFNALPSALKLAKPTIFFSVPRFFEKVYAAFLQNPLARIYLKTSEGGYRKLLRVLLKRGVLRKTGLNRCRQILVGSGPADPELLAFFQRLGIEIHNAYGLTEAPLVSLNRLERNRPDTAGELLPCTQARIGPEGEIMIRGPQVSTALEESDAYSDGWLSTGDMGVFTEQGHLELHGRIKDMLITSYGKKIFPTPIETRLRGIPGVAEALLVGEGRPYCTALFWMEEGTCEPACVQELKLAIQTINAGLSHSEHIKRWSILNGSLTTSNGFLTGSLKVKRTLVVQSLADVIDALYRGEMHPQMLTLFTS